MGLTQKLGTIPLAILTDSSNNVGIGAAANASFKLQVTGATNLTGALTGAAATFIGKLTIGSSSVSEGEIGIFETGGNYNFTTFKNGTVRTIIGSQSSTSQGFIGTASNHDLLLKTNDTTRLTIASTGAATFSSSVTADGQLKTTATGQSISINAAGTGSVRMQLQNNNTGNAGVAVESSTGGDQFSGTSAYSMAIGTYTARDLFLGTNSVQRFKLDASTGAATFSSSVTATQGTFSSAPSIGGYQVAGVSNSGSSTSYGVVQVLSVNGKAGYLTCGDNSASTWYGGQASFVTLGATLGAGIKFRVDADDTKGITIPTNGNVLIGSASDQGGWKAQVTGNLFVRGSTNTSANTAFYMDNSVGTLLFSVRNDGYMNIGTGASSPYNDTTATAANLVVNSSGSLLRSTASSQRFKENINDWNGSGLDTILLLKPKTFNYKESYYKYPQIEMLGLIAEEVAEVSPYLADYENEDRTGEVENVRYATIVVPLIKAIQELTQKVNALENKA